MVNNMDIDQNNYISQKGQFQTVYDYFYLLCFLIALLVAVLVIN